MRVWPRAPFTAISPRRRNAAGGSSQFVSAGVSKAEDLRALIETTASRFGRIDVLFNNAGYQERRTPIADIMMIGSKIANMNAVAAGLPLKRLERPEKVANAVLWLASKEASFVTGRILQVDGGFGAT